MNSSYRKLFTQMNYPEVSPDLSQRIIKRIEEENKFLAFKRKFYFCFLAMTGSIVLFAQAIKWTVSRAAESGFADFFSLIFSDFRVLASYWQSYIMSLMETLPVLDFVLMAAAILLFLLSVRFFLKNIKFIPRVFSQRHLINI